MQVKMLIGPKAGSVIDLPYGVGSNLVLKGQAEDVQDLLRLPKAAVTRVDVLPVENAAPMGEVSSLAPEPHRVPIAEGFLHKKKRK